MLIIVHRVNNTDALRATPEHFGVEIDLHGYGREIVVHHEPFIESITLERWLDDYAHSFVILNVKEEGIEARVQEQVQERGIKDYFMLDLSMPSLVKMVGSGESRVAVRVSEFEPVAGALCFAGRADWTWIDCFSGFPLSTSGYNALKGGGFKLCLVSPELVGRPRGEIIDLRRHLAANEFVIDAVCTKWPDLW